MSTHFARLHAARAMDALARMERGEPLLADKPESANQFYQLGYLKGTVRTLANDIESLLSLLEEHAECQP